MFEEQKRSHTFLVDEAHNLVDRSREMFSATLSKEPFLTVRRMFKGDLPELHRVMGRINRWFLTMRKQSDSGLPRIEKSAPDGLGPLLWADQFQMTLFCIDPSFQLAAALERSRVAIFFSATLTPMAYFIDMFGCHATTRRLVVPSPFPPQKQCVVICSRISTRYRMRTKTLPEVLDAIGAVLGAKPGNYLFFFPSHEYLTDAHAAFNHTGSDVAIKVQAPRIRVCRHGRYFWRGNRPGRRSAQWRGHHWCRAAGNLMAKGTDS
ncbi:MAG: hypothetical protein CSA11_11960 [Chloroflexi bacterium]|nr:MAG: hypothetical protein CSA11_11960 [Chloroflexota bacterium]